MANAEWRADRVYIVPAIDAPVEMPCHICGRGGIVHRIDCDQLISEDYMV